VLIITNNSSNNTLTTTIRVVPTVRLEQRQQRVELRRQLILMQAMVPMRDMDTRQLLATHRLLEAIRDIRTEKLAHFQTFMSFCQSFVSICFYLSSSSMFSWLCCLSSSFIYSAQL
jgi:hypothetical protein